jgi:7-cyano-7-deazaguanine synthase
MKAVTLLSGGLDSATLAYYVKYTLGADELICLSFDYGQRHRKELWAAERIAFGLGAEHHIIGLRVRSDEGAASEPLSSLLTGSALTDESVPVPQGHYAWDNMKITVVPNRNAIMLSIAYGIAVARKFDKVYFGAHAGDRAQYPDCTVEFVSTFDQALRIGNAWKGDERSVPQLEGPFLGLMKASIAGLAATLNVPIAETWSCYEGGPIHCGKCGTCVERQEAFALAGVEDPTPYADVEYWRSVTTDVH